MFETPLNAVCNAVICKPVQDSHQGRRAGDGLDESPTVAPSYSVLVLVIESLLTRLLPGPTHRHNFLNRAVSLINGDVGIGVPV